jgi:hypothetical protein
MEPALDVDGVILESAPVAENGSLEYVPTSRFFDQKAKHISGSILLLKRMSRDLRRNRSSGRSGSHEGPFRPDPTRKSALFAPLLNSRPVLRVIAVIYSFIERIEHIDERSRH